MIDERGMTSGGGGKDVYLAFKDVKFGRKRQETTTWLQTFIISALHVMVHQRIMTKTGREALYARMDVT